MTKKINFILIIIWMILIFTMSSFNSIESSNQSNIIVNLLVKLLNIKNIKLLSLVIRKLAHLSEYLILGILIQNLIKLYNKKVTLSIIICFIYATTDEIHQIFVPGRSCQIMDVIIDTIGAILGIIIINKIRKRRLLTK